MVYRLDAGTVIDAEGNLVIENLYAGSITQKTQAQGLTSGYTSGGIVTTTTQNIIDKFPFSSDGNATDVGNLIETVYRNAGQSSSAHGYSSGGAPTYRDRIEKFPFSSDNNSSDVGDLTVARENLAGQSSVGPRQLPLRQRPTTRPRQRQFRGQSG